MKRLLDIWHKFDQFVLTIERALIVIGLAVIMGAGMLNIFLRLSGFNEIVFTGMLLKQLTLWLGLLGAAIATSSSEHLNVDAFGRLLKNKGVAINNVVIGIVCIGFSGLFTYYSVKFFTFQSKQLTAQNVGGGPLAWMWIVIFPIAFGMMTLRYIFQTIEHGGVLMSPNREDIAKETLEATQASIEDTAKEGSDT